jgi:hypothetical protein
VTLLKHLTAIGLGLVAEHKRILFEGIVNLQPGRRLLIAMGLAALTSAPACAEDCETLLHLHGYLTVAAAKCRLVEAPNVIDAASACRAQSGSDVATRTATDGIRFAVGEMAAKGGVTAWCKFVQNEYPSLIGARSR